MQTSLMIFALTRDPEAKTRAPLSQFSRIWFLNFLCIIWLHWINRNLSLGQEFPIKLLRDECNDKSFSILLCFERSSSALKNPCGPPRNWDWRGWFPSRILENSKSNKSVPLSFLIFGILSLCVCVCVCVCVYVCVCVCARARACFIVLF